MSLQKHAASGLPPLKLTPREEDIIAAEHALGNAVRAARAGARPGDIFTPEVVPFFRGVMKDHYRTESPHERKEMLDEVPKFRPVVNQIYPPKLPKGAFPPSLLRHLPPLPEGLEYRIVGTYLVLRDQKANIIVDFIPDVLPPSAKKLEDRS